MVDDIELLSPCGDMDCVRAAVQNGANCIYFGSKMFSARASAANFDIEEIKEVVNYCKLRNVKTNLTINILLKDDEIEEAFNLAKAAYEIGVDAIIVQDLGFAKILIDSFPDMDIHASTQMTIHNLEEVLEAEKLGFKRVVLSRELSMEEIEYICKNSKIEIECFIHGALCISYSGQCLFSSMVGGRSGNRGKCAQACRLPYELFENKTRMDEGYLLSPRDFCSLDYIPRLIKAGVKSFKIEGRMKPPEYVAAVTRIYRKYIDMAQSGSSYIVDKKDLYELMQVFNRGNFSYGHLKENNNLIFKEKPNNMGLCIGVVKSINKEKGLINFKMQNSQIDEDMWKNINLEIGDTISIQRETGTYTVSEMIKDGNNIKVASKNDVITIGRMKGNIQIDDKIYKMSSKNLNLKLKKSYDNNSQIKNMKIKMKISINRGKPVCLEVTSENYSVVLNKEILLEKALNKPLTQEKVIEQLSKISNSAFLIETIEACMDSDIFIPNIKELNELRREAIKKMEEQITFSSRRTSNIEFEKFSLIKNEKKYQIGDISVLLNNVDNKVKYEDLDGIKNLYIPLKFWTNEFFSKFKELSKKYDLYVYMPTIMKSNYYNYLKNDILDISKGYIVSNISEIGMIDNTKKIIANYTLNIFNNYTVDELHKLGISRITASPELDLERLNKMNGEKDIIVYGRTPLMNMSYCLIGKSNKCFSGCTKLCRENNHIYLRDRMGFDFPLILDNIQTISTLYNSKITSIKTKDFSSYNYRIDIIDEGLETIQEIINKVRMGERFEGKEYTSGNLNRIV